MIVIKHLSKSFGKLEALKDVNLQIQGGQITAILGPNGSGKTTLIKSILGMVIPDKGDILVDGKPVTGEWQYRSLISYMPQISAFPENLTINDLIALLTRIRGEKGDPETFIRMFGLESYLNKRVKHLSGGTRQKANVMMACMFNSPLIIMDEPTSGLDPAAMLRLKTYVKEQKRQQKTVLFTTHIMSLVEDLADEIVFLLEGRIHYQGSPQALKQMTNANNLEVAIAAILQGSPVSNTTTQSNHVKSLAIQHD